MPPEGMVIPSWMNITRHSEISTNGSLELHKLKGKRRTHLHINSPLQAGYLTRESGCQHRAHNLPWLEREMVRCCFLVKALNITF